MRAARLLVALALCVLAGLVSCAEGESQDTGTPGRPDGAAGKDSGSTDGGAGSAGSDSALPDSGSEAAPPDSASPDGEGPDGGGTDSAPDGPCEPTTCEIVGNTCDEISDGCGGTLWCGWCTVPEICGGTGTAELLRLPAHALRSGQGLRDDRRQLRRHTRLRRLHGSADLRRRRHAERVRLHADHLRRSGQELRHDLERLRRHAELRLVHRAADLRRRRHDQRLRLHADHLRRSGQELRHAAQRLRRAARLRELHAAADLRRRRRRPTSAAARRPPAPLRARTAARSPNGCGGTLNCGHVHRPGSLRRHDAERVRHRPCTPDHLRRAGQELRHDLRRLRRHARLRLVHLAADLRRRRDRRTSAAARRPPAPRRARTAAPSPTAAAAR